MKIFECTSVFFLLGCGLVRLVAADIYANTAEDGSVSLSNMPADKQYQLLVAEDKIIVPAATPLAVQPVVVTPPVSVKPLAVSPAAAQKSLSTPTRKALYNRMVAVAARTHGLDVALLHAVISVESRYNHKAVSRAGAVGLMQLMPAIAKRYGVSDSFDPEQNINGGARYLRDLIKLFKGNVSLALAAYNAGEYAVIKNGNRIPPYPETRNYVPRVMDYYRQYQVKF
jgi:soluble lytic murein transglycosylase-like protein